MNKSNLTNMRLSKSEFISYLNKYKDMYDQLEKVEDALNCSVDTTFSKWIDEYYNFLSDMCGLPEGAYGTMLDYYCFERDFGERCVITEADGTEYKISTPAELYDFLVETYESEYQKG